MNQPNTPTTPAPAMTMVPVESSQIEAIGYHEPTKTLAVKFKAGSGSRLYHYAGFPPEEWARLKGATSTGSHFHKNIKGKYTYTKLP